MFLKLNILSVKSQWEDRGSQWGSVSLLEVSVFCETPTIPIATGELSERIPCVDDTGSSSSPKSEALNNKAGLLLRGCASLESDH